VSRLATDTTTAGLTSPPAASWLRLVAPGNMLKAKAAAHNKRLLAWFFTIRFSFQA
jgi:hypothetical protein